MQIFVLDYRNLGSTQVDRQLTACSISFTEEDGRFGPHAQVDDLEPAGIFWKNCLSWRQLRSGLWPV